MLFLGDRAQKVVRGTPRPRPRPLLKAHFHSLFSVRELDTRRHRRAINRRVKPAWKKRGVCNCVSCIPWYKEGLTDYRDPDRPHSLRVFRLRLHARYLMADLSPFWPRLTGVLAELDRTDFPYFESIEFLVEEAEFSALSLHLRAAGYEVERARREGQLVLEVEGLESFLVWAKPPADTPVLSLPELEEGLSSLYGRSFQQSARLAQRESGPRTRR